MTQLSSGSRIVRQFLGLAVLSAVGFGVFQYRGELQEVLTGQRGPQFEVTESKPLIELVSGSHSTIRLTQEDSAAILGVKVAKVRPAPAPEPLRLPGSLMLDPNRLIHVHSRFGGEAVSIGEVEEHGAKRPLQYGDHVKKGQVLAVIWSKDTGEKKSELVDALSRLDVSQSVLKRLEGLQRGVVAERTIAEARREVESNLIAVAKAERTLRSWRMTDAEIDGVRREYRSLQQRTSSAGAPDVEIERRWAQTEIRSAIDGVIVEKNFNVGDIVEPTDDLFKVADLSRLQVLANIYEEDLWAIRALKPEARTWSIDLKSDPTDNRIKGTFGLIGSVIDPAQRTGVVMGWLDNADNKLLIGQFITATIELPVDPNIVAIPETALIEEGDASTVFVETNAQRHEYSLRHVKVVRRCMGTVFVQSLPDGKDLEPLKIGETVVIQGSLGLGGELANLKSSDPHRT